MASERVACAFLVEACCEKYVPRKLPVAFVICIRANRCLLGLSKCFREFVGLLGPSGGDSFWGAGAQCTSWRVSCVRFVRVGRIPAWAANSTGAFLHVPRVIAFRLSSTRLRVVCASLVEGALRKACPSGNCHLVGFDVRTSCLCFPSGSLLRKVCPSKVACCACYLRSR